MPRGAPPLVYRMAKKCSPLLPYFLPACRTVAAAQQELRWVQQELPPAQWLPAAKKRQQHYPLQYLLGTQPFGELELKCEPGVLIPRWETEEWVLSVAGVLVALKYPSKSNPLDILDLCTGTGCIPLLLQRTVGSRIRTMGVDVSAPALALARANCKSTGLSTSIVSGNVFEPDSVTFPPLTPLFRPRFLTANPPYIPRLEFENASFNRSVKRFEPELALVGDLEFYHALVDHWILPTAVEGFVLELGEEYQAQATCDRLGSTWECGVLYDSNAKVRCVVGWQKGGPFASLQTLCQRLL